MHDLCVYLRVTSACFMCPVRSTGWAWMPRQHVCVRLSRSCLFCPTSLAVRMRNDLAQSA